MTVYSRCLSRSGVYRQEAAWRHESGQHQCVKATRSQRSELVQEKSEDQAGARL